MPLFRHTETITWREGAPKNDRTVLLSSEHFDAGTGSGWRCVGQNRWYDISGYPIKAEVTAWAEMPSGQRRKA